MSDYDVDDDGSNDAQDYEENITDEDTEDASETDMLKYEGEYTEIKEQMYQDKLANLKEQLKQLDTNTHPEYVRRVKKIEQAYNDRIILNEAFLSFEKDRIEKEYVNEKRASADDFEDRKIELKESLMCDLEEKKRMIEMERTSVELTTDSTEPKPVTTRKLRRRPNDPVPLPEKRKRVSPQLNQLLEESDILDDLKAINKSPSKFAHLYENQSDVDSVTNMIEARIEDGKLYYDKKWYHRGQPISVKGRDGVEYPASLASVHTTEIWVRKVPEGNKNKILLTHLQKGKYSLLRRAS